MAHGCPFISDAPDPEGIYYNEYLSLDTVLKSQKLVSEANGSPVHDEMLFIIIHQVHELWFKQIIFEIDSIRDIFKYKTMDEKNTLKIVQRLNRVLLILKLVTDQIPILETMTPQDFLAFRDFLAPASGFQSWQFRKIEIKLGLRTLDRLGKSAVTLQEMLKIEHRTILFETEEEESLSLLIQKWLERTPGLEEDNFSFFEHYKSAVYKKIQLDKNLIELETDQLTKDRMSASIKKTMDTFDDIFNVEAYNVLHKNGQRKFTHKALFGALMINVYRQLPRFSQPFQILTLLSDMDTQLTKWRNAHCQMAQRMIGSRIGTGSSSGYHYLRSTLSDHYKVFVDLSSLSTYLIPPELTPPLPESVERIITSQM